MLKISHLWNQIKVVNRKQQMKMNTIKVKEERINKIVRGTGVKSVVPPQNIKTSFTKWKNVKVFAFAATPWLQKRMAAALQ